MLGFEALGIFALGQAEPWTLKGRRARRRGRIVQPPELPQIEVVQALPPPPPPVATIDGVISGLILDRLSAEQARWRDDEEAIAILLMAA